ncbi:hypothetical protein C8F01DRAFT_1374872 [Mycena amicta]|nr:hypothetical protein C8F01DRAFT_1374872 [Mycena amicta]
MPAPSFPDELISEILSPALRVPDVLFSDTSNVSPFADYAPSSSNYLLVCKGWLRVGTPLLYGTVVIRSKDQARALARTFSENEDADLGRFVKKLRIDSGYGIPMRVIFQSIPNLTDLYLCLDVAAPDAVDPTCKGLQLVSPTTLILKGHSSLSPGKSANSKLISKLANGVSEAIPGWKNLTTVKYSRIAWEKKFSRPLAKSARLTTLFVRSVQDADGAYTIFASCPLQTIYILERMGDYDRKFLDERPALRKLVKLAIQPRSAMSQIFGLASSQPVVDEPLPALNPFYIPMAAAAEDVQNAVWSRVLYFAMAVVERGWEPKPANLPEKLPLLLVCRKFHSLGLPHFFTHIRLPLPYNWYMYDRPRDERDTHLLSALAHRPPIQTVLGNQGMLYAAWTTFVKLAECAGDSLFRCQLRVAAYDSEASTSPTVFMRVTVLRELDWMSLTRFTTEEVPEGADWLPKLETLRVYVADQSFLTMLSRLSLPALRRLSFLVSESPSLDCEPLIRVHGVKLTELDIDQDAMARTSVPVLDLCPNITSVVMQSSSYSKTPSSINFLPTSPHASLTMLSVTWLCRIVTPRKYDSWETFITTFDLTLLPSLEEVRPLYFTWPKSEQEIAVDPYIHWSEILLKRNLHLVSEHGKRWRARLRVKGGATVA